MGKHFGKAEATAAGEWSNFVIFLLEHGIKRTCFSTQMLYAVFSNLRWLISVPRNIVTLTLVDYYLFFFLFSVHSEKSKKISITKICTNMNKEFWVPSVHSEAECCYALIPHISLHLISEFTFFFFQFSCSIYLLITENDMCNNDFI